MDPYDMLAYFIKTRLAGASQFQGTLISMVIR